LVSSVRYSKDAIARKIKRERWRGATIDEVETLREHLAGGSSEVKDAEI
jgi:hypothetical protein